MPRKAKGQRTDLNRPTQAVKVAPSQQYGQGAQQIAAQKAIPLPNSAPIPTGPPPQAMPPGPPAQVAPPSPMLGDLGALDRPTDRPSEPLTAGMSIGTGGGPDTLSQAPESMGPVDGALKVDLAQMRNYLPALELMASAPDASDTTRNLVRRIRGAMPTTEPMT